MNAIDVDALNHISNGIHLLTISCSRGAIKRCTQFFFPFHFYYYSNSIDIYRVTMINNMNWIICFVRAEMVCNCQLDCIDFLIIEISNGCTSSTMCLLCTHSVHFACNVFRIPHFVCEFWHMSYVVRLPTATDKWLWFLFWTDQWPAEDLKNCLH